MYCYGLAIGTVVTDPYKLLATIAPYCSDMESSDDTLAEQLIDACSKREVAKVEHLLNEGACPSKLVSRTSALHLVCGQLEDLHLLKALTRETCNIDTRDLNGWTPLHYACFHGHLDLVTYLIHTLKCDPNLKDNEGKTPLHMMCSFLSSEQEYSLKIVELLIDKAGCDCNAITNKGDTPLMLLCRNSGSKVIVEYLIHTCHCDISQKDNSGNNALHIACMCTCLDQAEMKANIEQRNLQIVKIITATGSNCGMYSYNDQNACPLEIAINNDFVNIARFLIIEMNRMAESSLNLDLKWDATPLHIVCKFGQLELLTELSKMKCSNIMLTQNSKGELSIQLAIQHNHLAVVYLIWEFSFKERLQLVKAIEGFPFQMLEIPTDFLHYICGKMGGHSDLDALKVLKECYVNHNHQLINQRDNPDGLTPLHYSCSHGLFDIMVFLINEYKADVTLQTKKGESLLHLIISSPNTPSVTLDVVKFLITKAGCSPNITTRQNGDTPLMYFANNHCRSKEKHSVAYYLIFSCSCNLAIQNKQGNTVLHIACSTGNDIIVQMIVDYDSNIAHRLLTRRNNEGNTPLHLACYNRKLNIILRCYKYCGPFELSDNRYKLLQLAISNKHYEIISALLQVMKSKSNITGKEVLHTESYKNEDIQLLQCLANSNYRTIKSIHGDTLLHLACEVNDFHLCEILLEECCDVNIMNQKGNTPLHIACQKENVHLCEALLKADCDINIQNNNGDTPLHTACQMDSIHLCELLLEACCDVNIKSNNGNTPFHIACQTKGSHLCELLLEACSNINVKNRNGDTPLHLAFSSGNFEVVQLLINDPQVNTGLKNIAGDTLLHIACRSKLCTPEMVNYVLAVVKSDPTATNNNGMKPIQLTTNAQKIHKLIQYGANPTDVYYSVSNLKISTKHPPQALVKIFVVGNPLVGKSTLVASLQQERSFIVKVLTPARKVSGVNEKTAGIIPCAFESKRYGQVALYDFAGQPEYYSTHAALLQNSIESSPPVFLIVVNLCKSYEDITTTILYWLSFLENQCTSVNNPLIPHVIVIGSHADVLENKGEKIQEKSSVIDHIKVLPYFKSLEIINFISMDCQYSQSAGMKKLREQLRKSCKKLRIKEEIRFNTHCFLVYLLDKFRDLAAVTLDQIFTQVSSERKVASESNPLFFLPDCLSSLFDLCYELNDRGHVLFLKDKQTLMNSWVVLDQHCLLNEVLGTILAPQGLKEYCSLASNTGVVPISKMIEKFSKYDSNMIVGFLTHLEFCHEVSDKEILQLINYDTQSDIIAQTTELETYLFFPALIKLEAPDGMWKVKPQFINHFGWMLQCSCPEQFFTSRFLEVLLLRLAFSYALTTDTCDEGPSLKRKCTIWKNGIFWGDRNGNEILVEVHSCSKAVVVLMRSFQEELTPFLQLRSSIIQKVLITVLDFCAKVNTVEYFIDPSEVNSYPLNPKTLYNAQEVFNVIVLKSMKSAYVVSENGESIPLETLLTLEPYAYLGYNILSKMFSVDSSHCKKVISDHVIMSLSEHFAQISDVILTILCHSEEQTDCISSQSRDLIHSLKAWQEKSDGTYHCLRQTFDQYSTCAGRNLLVRHFLRFSVQYQIYDTFKL